MKARAKGSLPSTKAHALERLVAEVKKANASTIGRLNAIAEELSDLNEYLSLPWWVRAWLPIGEVLNRIRGRIRRRFARLKSRIVPSRSA